MNKFAHELTTGDVYEPLTFVISAEMNQQFLFAQETYSNRYLDQDDGSPAMVAPALLLQMAANTRSASFRLAEGTGSILSEATATFLAPAYVGRELRVEWRVTSEYEKRGRRYYVMEAAVDDLESRKPVLRRDLHLTFPTSSDSK